MIKLGLLISIQQLSDGTMLTPLMCASLHYLHSGMNRTPLMAKNGFINGFTAIKVS